MSALLSIANLYAGYDKSQVLKGIDLSVQPGEIVSLLGRNGAGRSTLVKAIMGQIQASGSIRFKQEEMLGWPTYKIARAGIAYVAESRDVFPTLTVAQNLALGEQRDRKSRWSIADMTALFPHLEKRMHVAAGLLSGGEQQMLALARAMLGDPELILVDEPTEGLSPQLVGLIAEFLQKIARNGTAVLLIEQKLSIALSISQRIYLMGHGQIVHEGTPENLREHDTLCREWLAI